MLDTPLVRSVLEFLYSRMFFLYWPLYRGYKAWIDRKERALVRKLVQPGATVVDVGANIGVYAKFFAKIVGKEGRVFAFEPDPVNARHLSALTRKCPVIEVLPYAAGDSTGTLSLYQSKGFNFDHRMFAAPGDSSSVVVDVVRIDDVSVLNEPRVSLFKIDVQGAELAVLRGATETLRRNADAVVMLEYAPWGIVASGSTPSQFVEYLRSLGYHIFGLDGSTDTLTIGLSKTQDRYWYRNLVLTRNDSLSGLTKLI